MPKSSAATAAAAQKQSERRDRHGRPAASTIFFAGATGSGGRLYTSGLSTSRKKAFSPSVPGC